MKVAIVGSRDLVLDLDSYLPKEATEIISGGAKGIDSCARRVAEKFCLPFTEISPDYSRYKRAAPLVRNRLIVDTADLILIFWNGASTGTRFVIEYAKKANKPVQIFLFPKTET